MPKIYTDELKQSALELINDVTTQKQVCADLGVSKSALQSWVRDSRLREHGLEPAKDHEGSRAQAAAIKRIRELERENKILREAAAYLSQANLKLGVTTQNDASMPSVKPCESSALDRGTGRCSVSGIVGFHVCSALRFVF
ncbi:transposase [Citricoccus muralis]|uniref:Transposase n=1 Tax=Citricoccus muralis TaxID=169134 RepID=A0ABY8H9D6_9MICC|nr:transposase [Citricoccus muralis]WFP17760.1 transposase [Citricoccus muralis]